MVKKGEGEKFILKKEHLTVPLLLKSNGSMKTLQLPIRFTRQLIKLPETGMGYQLVKIFLKNGLILNNHKVLNSSLLILENDEKFENEEIVSIEMQ